MNDAIITNDTSATSSAWFGSTMNATVDAEERTFWEPPTDDNNDDWQLPNIPTGPPTTIDVYWSNEEYSTSSPVSSDGNNWWNDDWRYYDDDNEGQIDGTALAITVTIVIIICIVASMIRHNMRTDRNGNNRAANVNNNNNTRQTTARATLAASPRATAPAEEKPVDPELRAKIVKAIFPEQKVDDSDLHYDEEAQSLRWIDNNKDGNNSKNLNTTCSICLDKFAEGDLIISSLCSHIYHRECVMEWAQTKDDCPMCRQKMWDEDTYGLLEENIKRLGKSCALGR